MRLVSTLSKSQSRVAGVGAWASSRIARSRRSTGRAGLLMSTMRRVTAWRGSPPAAASSPSFTTRGSAIGECQVDRLLALLRLAHHDAQRLEAHRHLGMLGIGARLEAGGQRLEPCEEGEQVPLHVPWHAGKPLGEERRDLTAHRGEPLEDEPPCALRLRDRERIDEPRGGIGPGLVEQALAAHRVDRFFQQHAPQDLGRSEVPPRLADGIGRISGRSPSRSRSGVSSRASSISSIASST